MISDHEFSVGRGCPTKILHARANLPRQDQGGGMAAWMRAESGRVRALSRHLFPAAVRVGATDPVAADAETRQLIARGVTVGRARLSEGDLRCEADFIEPDEKTLRVYQVLARPLSQDQIQLELEFTKVNGEVWAHWRSQIELMAFRLEVIRAIWPQHRVLAFFVVPVKGRKSGIEGLPGYMAETADGWLCTHPDAEAEAKRLLVTAGVTKECEAVAAGVRRQIKALQEWFEYPTAPVLGYSCTKCLFKVKGAESGFERCWGPLARVTPHMFDLAYMYFIQEGRKPVADRLAREGKVSLWDIPTDLIDGKHADRQFLQLEGMRAGQVIVDNELQDEMAAVTFPLHFLDVETTEAVLPPHRGARVGALQIFQLSVHRRTHAGATLEHVDWLNTEREEPNRRFLAALRAGVGDHGTVLVYASHERKSFNSLLADLIDRGVEDDDLRWLGQFLNGPRLVDMHKMARHVWYPGMAGKTSLKRLLPSVWAQATEVKRRIPYAEFPLDKDPYAVLEAAGQVSEGCTAMSAYLAMQASDGKRRENLVRELREYCGVDTLAMAFCWDAWEHELAQRRAVPRKVPNGAALVAPGVEAIEVMDETALAPITSGVGADA